MDSSMNQIKAMTQAKFSIERSINCLSELDLMSDFLEYFYGRKEDLLVLKNILTRRQTDSKKLEDKQLSENLFKLSNKIAANSYMMDQFKKAVDQLYSVYIDVKVDLLGGLEYIEMFKKDCEDIQTQLDEELQKSREQDDNKNLVDMKASKAMSDLVQSSALVSYLQKDTQFAEACSLSQLMKCPTNETSPKEEMTDMLPASMYAVDTTISNNGELYNFFYICDSLNQGYEKGDQERQSNSLDLSVFSKENVGQVLARWQFHDLIPTSDNGFALLIQPKILSKPLTCSIFKGYDFEASRISDYELTCSARDRFKGEPVKFSENRDTIALRETSNQLLVMTSIYSKEIKITITTNKFIRDFAVEKVGKIVHVAFLVGDAGSAKVEYHQYGPNKSSSGYVKPVKYSYSLQNQEIVDPCLFLKCKTSTSQISQGTNDEILIFQLGLQAEENKGIKLHKPCVEAFSLIAKDKSFEATPFEITIEKTQEQKLIEIFPSTELAPNLTTHARITSAFASYQDTSKSNSIYNLCICFPWIAKLIFAVVAIPSQSSGKDLKNISCLMKVADVDDSKQAYDIRVQAAIPSKIGETGSVKKAFSVIVKKDILKNKALKDCNLGNILFFGN